LSVLHKDANGDIVKLLLEHQAKLDILDKSGGTPLHTAVASGKKDVVKAF